MQVGITQKPAWMKRDGDVEVERGQTEKYVDIFL